MEVDALSPSPLARFLLELERREASGRLEIGGRRVVLHDGAITDVLPAEGDMGLLGFMLAAGRLTEEQSRELPEDVQQEGGVRLDQEVLRRELLDRGTLRETRRALWLDRLVRGLAVEEEQAQPPRHLEPHNTPAGPYRVSTLPLILDVLTRRAGRADAERIGHHAAARFEWLDVGEQTARARRWADLGNEENPRPVSAVLLSHPGAASRVAALVRAGLARLTRASDPPPPPEKRRAPSIPPPTGRRVAPSSPPRAGAPAGALDPGMARLPDAPFGIEPVDPWFSVDTAPLEDPLDALERRITTAEQTRLPGPQRAELWLEFARVALEHYGSIEEAARGAREAAAADPDSAEAHHLAAEYCASTGQPALAYAYAKAAAALTEDSRQRMQRLSQVALYAARCGKAASGVRALQQACSDPAADAWVFEQYARMLHTQQDALTAQWARKAAAKNEGIHPVRASHLLAWASSLAPSDPEIAAEYASQLAQQGLGEAATVALLSAARHSEDAERRANLRSNAAIRAELGGRPDMAAEALLDSFEEDPRKVTLHEPLVANLEAAGLRREAALLAEEIAGVCPPAQRGPWLLRATRLHLEEGGCGPLLRRLLGEALKCQGDFDTVYEQVEQLAQREESMRVVTDVLEVALRDPELPRETRELAIERLVQAAAELGAPALERWGHALRNEQTGVPLSEADLKRLSEAGQARSESIVALENRIEDTNARLRTPLLLELARLWRDDPQRRIRAIKQYDQILQHNPNTPGVATDLCELMWLADDLDALVRNATADPEHTHREVLLSGAYAARMQGEFTLVCELALAVLAQSPHDDEALGLLARAERAGLPAELAAQATDAQLRGTSDPRRRARALTRLADHLLVQGDVVAALDAAERALAADPRAARAAEIATQHHAALDSQRALALARAARQVLGDQPGLLWQLAQAAGLTEERERQQEALEALTRQSPFLAAPAVELLRVTAEVGEDTQALMRSIETALSPARRTQGTAMAVLQGLRRLWTLGEHERALRLAVTAADALGEGTDELLEWAEQQAAQKGMSRVRATVLERLIARLTGEARLARLRDLAHLEHTCERPASEVRAWLRVLALEPSDDEGLARLSALYGQAGDADRMLSALTLRLEAATEPNVRALALLDLAAASLVVADDAVTASEMVRGAIDEHPEVDLNLLQRAVGLLLSRNPQAAFDLLLELAADDRHRTIAGSLYQEAVTLAATQLEQPGLALSTAVMALEQVPERTQVLLLLERLALDEGRHELGAQVYDELLDRSLGMHGRRALLYRKARFLERAGLPSDALDAYVEGFHLAPSAGVVLASIERLSEQCRRPETLVECLLELAPMAPFADRRTELYARASDLCDRLLGDPRRALEIRFRSFQASGEAETAYRAAGILQRLGEEDAEARDEAIAQWREFLEDRSEQAWDVGGKVNALLRLATLEAIGMQDLDAVTALAERAIVALDEDTDDVDEGATRAGLYADVARMLREAGAAPELIVQACERGLELQPEHEDLKALHGSPSLPAPDDGPAQASHAPAPEARPHSAQPYSATPDRPSVTTGVVQVPGALMMGKNRPVADGITGATLPPPDIAPLPPLVPALPAEALADGNGDAEELDSLCRAVAEGDEGAAARMLESVHGRTDRAALALAKLLSEVHQGATSETLLTGLATLGPLAGREEIRVVAREALMEPEALEKLAEVAAPATSGEALGEALALARTHEPTATARHILGLTWQNAAPLFRRTLHSYNASSDNLLSQSPDDPIAQAFATAAMVTGQSCELYVVPGDTPQLAVTCTTPPAILVTGMDDARPEVMRLRFAASLERTRDEALLASALPPEDAERLFDALRAAFGPTSGRDSLEREAASVAAELWRTIPPLVQREITERFRDLEQPLVRAPVALALEMRAARVGLLACGHLGVALQHVADIATSPTLASTPGREGPLGRALLAYAFSEPYLKLRSQ